jgi:hypothetical protein
LPLKSRTKNHANLSDKGFSHVFLKHDDKLVMKLTFVALFFLINSSLFAADHTVERLVKCLGKEEAKIHKNKLGGAVYELNQRLISELIMFNKIEVVPNIINDICSYEGKVFPSVKLLEHLINKQEQFFIIPRRLPAVDKEILQATVTEFLDLLPEIFYMYIAQVQAVSARPACLEDHVPALKELNRDIKALEQDIPARQLMSKNKIASKVMFGIRDVESIWKKCDEEYKKKIEEEKKKLLSGNKP